MHIQWKRDPVEGRDGSRQFRLAAFLVADSDNVNRPGVGAVTLLGSVEERFLFARIKGMREFYRGLFWSGIDNSLDSLSLENSQRETLEVQISHKISRPGKQWALWGVTCNSRFD